MGSCMSSEPDVDFTGPVDFNHFHILRAIGKGAFGKVCIVKKRDTKQMYAMKYMNKVQIIKKHAVENVFREINILQTLEHPFLVNLWFTFQDREDIFMVLDLMLGGDLSYHLEKEGRFQVPRVRLYVAELALVLEYLRSRNILHRDVKPANMLLDSQGHVHLTDFNVACVVKPNAHITSITGTKPYMAPEVVHPSGGSYSYPVDWWSLGVSAYEMLRGQRPFLVERHTTNEELYSQLRHTRPSASARWDTSTCDVLKLLLHPDEDKRLQSVEKMKELKFFESIDWVEVEEKTTTPSFVPPQNRINCDPTYELEEMIVEPNPLHKKQHRLSKRRFKSEDEDMERELDKIERRFKVYSREQEKEKPAEAETGSEQMGNNEGGERNDKEKNKSSEKLQSNLAEIKEVEESEETGSTEEKEGKCGEVAVSEEKSENKKEVEEESKAVEVEVHEEEKEKVEETVVPIEENHKVSEGEGATQNNTSEKPTAENPSNIERTESDPPTVEGEDNKSPTTSDGDNVASFSSVKHLLS